MEETKVRQGKRREIPKFFAFGLFLVFVFVLANFAIIFSAKPAAAASAPSIITYQGKLLISGKLATTTQNIYFILYNAPTGGSIVYTASGTVGTPQPIAVYPVQGLFSVNFGDTGTNGLDPTIFANDGSVYLEVRIGADTLTPRKRITAAPYAFNAKYLDGYGASTGHPASSYIPVSDASGNFVFNSTTISTSTVGDLVVGNSVALPANSIGPAELANTTVTATTYGANNKAITFTVDADGRLTYASSTLIAINANQITAGTIANTQGGTGQDSSGWTGFVKVTGGVWATSTINLAGGDVSGMLAASRGGTGADSSGWTGVPWVNGGVWANSTTIGIGFGGTGATSVGAAGSISYSNGTNYAFTAAGSNGEILQSTGAGVPIWVSTSSLGFASSSGSNAYIQNQSSANQTASFRITATGTLGALGINTTSPSALLTVVDGAILAVSSTNPVATVPVYGAGTRMMWIPGKAAFRAGAVDPVGSGFGDGTEWDNANIGNYSTAFGWSTMATGTASVAMGIGTVASADYATAFGEGTIASGRSATALGAFSTASGEYSFVQGHNSLAAGHYAVALGTDVTSTGDNSIVLGSNMQTLLGADYSVGIGLSSTNNFSISQANTMAIMGGNVGIGTTSPQATLHVEGGNILQTIGGGMSIRGTVESSTALGTAYAITVSGKYAYMAASSNSTLTVVDISNPSSPTIISSLTDGTSFNSVEDLRVSGKYLYAAATFGNRVSVVDISNPSSPAVVGWVSVSQPRAIYVSGKYAYTVSWLTNGILSVVDISVPTSPRVVGSLVSSTYFNGAQKIVVVGKYAYVTAADANRLTIVDVSDPQNPNVVGSVQDATNLNYPAGLYVSGRYVYVAAALGQRLTVVDISNPSAPVVASSINDSTLLNNAWSVFVSGRYAYVSAPGSNRITAVDISNPSSPFIASSLNDSSYLNGVRGLYVEGKYIYADNTSGNGLTIVDISGFDSPGANIGDLLASNINVSENLGVSNNLSVRGGLNVGDGGIASYGAISIFNTSTPSYFAGSVGIGTSTPTGTLQVAGTSTLRDVVPETNLAYNLGASTSRWNNVWAGAVNIGTSTWSLTTGADKRLQILDAPVGGNERVSVLQNGNVGINTINPQAILEVDNGPILASGTTGNTPASGAGTRMMWIPSKAAFRAGSVNGTQWDDMNIGSGSVAFGSNNKAAGMGSLVFGDSNSASGPYSFAGGQYSSADLPAGTAFAFGTYATSSASEAIAMGRNVIASQGQAMAFGLNVTSSAFVSFGAGENIISSGNQSVAMGANNTATNDASVALGSYINATVAGAVGIGSFINVTGQHSVGVGLGYSYDTLSANNTFGILNGSMIASGTTGNTPASGAGTRMMWVPSLAAFRAGQVDGAEWDNANIGNHSVAFGQNTTSSGESSIAMGYNTAATGNFGSFAVGNNTVASNQSSFASGYYSSASGMFSMAMGYYAVANNNSSIALGTYVTSSGMYSLATGFNTTASGGASIAMGTDIIVSGDRSFGINIGTLGPYTVANSGVMAIMGGNVGIGSTTPLAALSIQDGAILAAGTTGATPISGTGTRMMWIPSKMAFRAGNVGDFGADGTSWDDGNIGLYSAAFGYNTKASDRFTMAFGSQSQATSQYAVAGGAGAIASNNAAVALGWDVHASGAASVAMGYGPTASNTAATALGYYTVAGGIYSTALGYLSRATTDWSTAIGAGAVASNTAATALGYYTVAGGQYSTALGYYSQANGNYSTALGAQTTVSGNYSLGIGLDGNPYTVSASNAMSIMGGNVGIGSTTPQAKLTVKDGAILAAGTTGATPISGAGTRLMWVPSHQAFRAGYVDGTQWDDSNIGNYSFAGGYNTIASGYESFAFGSGAVASGSLSVAFGNSNVAGGQYSLAGGGYNSTSTGDSSFAWGSYNIASGTYSFAFGSNVIAGASYDFGMGQTVTVGGLNSFGFGSRVSSTGNNSFAAGVNVQATGNNSYVFGTGNTVSEMLTNSISNSFMVGFSDTSTPAFYTDINGVGVQTTTLGGYRLKVDAGTSTNPGIGVNGYVRATGLITQSTNLDLAERYRFDPACSLSGNCPSAGDLVCLKDASVDLEVQKCADAYNKKVVGIVSTNPGFMMEGGLDDSNSVVVALAGRVPVKVGTVNGAIHAGDKLTPSADPGVAMLATEEGATVGTALEDFSGPGTSTIMVYTSIGWNNKLYRGLSVDDVNHKLIFPTSTIFEANVGSYSGARGFVFNVPAFDTSTSDRYIISARSNNNSVFSVSANGDVNALGNYYGASAVLGTSTNPGDLAERVDIAIDDAVEAGDVMMVDPNIPDTFRRTSNEYEQTVAGVISTNPTVIVGNGKTDYKAVLAMVGRVPVKVTNINGSIKRGDLLVASSLKGYAMKYDPTKDNSYKMVSIVGIALENQDEANTGGKVMALIRTGWIYNRDQTLSTLQDHVQQIATAEGINLSPDAAPANLNVNSGGGQLNYTDGVLNLNNNAIVNVASIVGANNKWKIDEAGNLIQIIATAKGDKETYGLQSSGKGEIVITGTSTLENGTRKVILSDLDQEIIDKTVPIKVQITMAGDTKGVYVAERNFDSFVVKENENGTSNAPFDWTVIAKVAQGNSTTPSPSPAPVSDAAPPPPQNAAQPNLSASSSTITVSSSAATTVDSSGITPSSTGSTATPADTSAPAASSPADAAAPATPTDSTSPAAPPSGDATALTTAQPPADSGPAPAPAQ